jgi:hypothetical protein
MRFFYPIIRLILLFVIICVVLFGIIMLCLVAAVNFQEFLIGAVILVSSVSALGWILVKMEKWWQAKYAPKQNINS